MKKVWLILFLLTIIQIPVYSANKRMEPTSGGTGALPNIFIYEIPDDDTQPQTNNNTATKTNTKKNQEQKINNKTQTTDTDEEVQLNLNDNTTLGATTLKGYAQYVEDAEEIYLKDDNDNFVLNIKVPQKISSSQNLDFSSYSQAEQISKYTNSEYNIAPKTINTQATKGDFTFGALYGNEIDNIAMLESETGLFTKYEKEKFAVSSSFKKSLNTTYAKDYNTISVTPELKLNSYISLKNKLSADITRNRRSSELIFSLNPFGKKDKDRMLLEAGAKQTYFMDTGENKTQLNFSATFKL